MPVNTMIQEILRFNIKWLFHNLYIPANTAAIFYNTEKKNIIYVVSDHFTAIR